LAGGGGSLFTRRIPAINPFKTVFGGARVQPVVLRPRIAAAVAGSDRWSRAAGKVDLRFEFPLLAGSDRETRTSRKFLAGIDGQSGNGSAEKTLRDQPRFSPWRILPRDHSNARSSRGSFPENVDARPRVLEVTMVGATAWGALTFALHQEVQAPAPPGFRRRTQTPELAGVIGRCISSVVFAGKNRSCAQ